MYLRNILFTLIICFSVILNSFGQEMNTHRDLYLFIDQQVQEDTFFHFTVKPYSPFDFELLNKFKRPEYKNKILNKALNEKLINIKNNTFSFSVIPILSSAYSVSENKKFILDHKLGLNIKSTLSEKLFFVTDIFYGKKSFYENERQFVDSFGVIPGYTKFINTSGQFYNYLNITGELIFAPTKFVSFHVGRGKHFLGNGFRSLLLSDNAAPYPYFKTTVDIWRIKYIWMFSKLKDYELFGDEPATSLYDKAAFIHYLSLNLTKNINFNFFETIITNPYDIEGRRKGYEISYFNPVVFYRPVEFYTGSSDNSLMGAGLNFKLRNQYFIYSQFILDDLVIASLKKKDGWWGNKFGVQAGVKAHDLFDLKGLFVRYEFNAVKPFTYSHGESYSEEDKNNLNYGHYRQALGHPSGSNFTEHLFVLKYLKGRFLSQFKFIYLKKGFDTDSVSYGGDIYKAYDLRNSDYDVSFLQGSQKNIIAFEISEEFLINPEYDLFFFLKGRFISYRSGTDNNTDLFFEFGLSTKIFNEDKIFCY